MAAAGLGLLGLSEQTGVLSIGRSGDDHGRTWRVFGPGSAHWYPPGGGDPTVACDAETLVLPG